MAECRLNLPLIHRGKVRDVYRLPVTPEGEARLLLVATDRISAFDVVMPTPVPGKGRMLTALSVFWLRWLDGRGLGPTHLLGTDVSALPDAAFGEGTSTREELAGRIMIGKVCRVIPIECVVRGYLEGSGWADYRRTGQVSGVRLPPGLAQCSRLAEPIFTPSTKAEPPAHDQPVSFERACEIVGREAMAFVRDRSLAIYRAAAEHALARGVIIADTKFEFGVEVDGKGRPLGEGPMLVDEVLTPDSSRFWPADTYQPGRAQASFDKQFVREFLEGLVSRGAWSKQPPGPDLPEDVVRGTIGRYAEALDRLTGPDARAAAARLPTR